LQAGVEECDDGNVDDADACTAACTIAVCGDGSVQAGVEECDDGNDLDTDECLVTCVSATCGDAIVWEGVEACDDGNADDADMCTNACALASCGDGIVEVGVEECDDGNKADTDACTSLCKNAVCGDGFLEEGVEECDDANQSNADECINTCTIAKCGDGQIHEGFEECDDGNAVDGDGCLNACTVAKCGDGVIRVGVEQCDDKNQINTDGCSNKCFKTPTSVTIGAPGATTALIGNANANTTLSTFTCAANQAIGAFGGQLFNTNPQTQGSVGGGCGAASLVVVGNGFGVNVAGNTTIGPLGTGNVVPPWSRQCAANQVAIGYSGYQSATKVHQLTFTCAPLVVTEQMNGAWTLSVGTPANLAAIGPVAGNAVGQTNCPAGQVATRITGRAAAAASLDNFQLGCAAPVLNF